MIPRKGREGHEDVCVQVPVWVFDPPSWPSLGHRPAVLAQPRPRSPRVTAPKPMSFSCVDEEEERGLVQWHHDVYTYRQFSSNFSVFLEISEQFLGNGFLVVNVFIKKCNFSAYFPINWSYPSRHPSSHPSSSLVSKCISDRDGFRDGGGGACDSVSTTAQTSILMSGSWLVHD